MTTYKFSIVYLLPEILSCKFSQLVYGTGIIRKDYFSSSSGGGGGGSRSRKQKTS